MYFEFSAFYKRDAAFMFSQERNGMKLFELRTGQPLNIDKPLEFEVDKIDSYMKSYDLLPTYDAPLVSARFKDIFSDLADDIQFVNARIIDEKNNTNDNFYYMNILNVLPIMDKTKSVVEIEKTVRATYINIKKLYVIEGSLKEHSIVRMEEDDSYIMVTEEFKKRCEDAKLKGLHFTEEGNSIYTDLD
mgnify:CR=1 FL=1